MAAGTFLTPAVAVLATFIIDDLALTRGEVGLAPAAFATVAAVMSPLAGRTTDWIGGRSAVAVTFLMAGVGLMALTLSVSVWTLVLAAGVAGIGQAFANPGTNKLLAVHVPVGRRGLATGLKQSGVQIGTFLAGIVLPSVAVAWGWRPTLAVAGGAYLAWLLVLPVLVPADPPRAERAWRADTSRVPPDVWWLAVYGLLMGAAGGAVTVYLPLYAEEGLGMSARLAGVLAGMTGLAAFVARILWSSLSEHVRGFGRPLGAMAMLAAAATAAMAAAPTVGPWLLWSGALAHAATGLAWNSVGMLAVMAIAGPARAGHASGIVLLGFLGGFGLGPAAFGRSVDVTGDYRVGLVAAAGAFTAALLCSWAMRGASAPPRASVGE